MVQFYLRGATIEIFLFGGRVANFSTCLLSTVNRVKSVNKVNKVNEPTTSQPLLPYFTLLLKNDKKKIKFFSSWKRKKKRTGLFLLH